MKKFVLELVAVDIFVILELVVLELVVPVSIDICNDEVEVD